MSRPVTEDDHAAITRALQTEGGHLSIGHAGFTLYWKDGWLSGYVADGLKAVCITRGLPVIDNRSVPLEALARIVISGPMAAVGTPADPPPWHPLSHAPLTVVAAACRAAGADVHNIVEADLAARAEALEACTGLRATGDLA
jgi:hypothetical protein